MLSSITTFVDRSTTYELGLSKNEEIIHEFAFIRMGPAAKKGHTRLPKWLRLKQFCDVSKERYASLSWSKKHCFEKS